MNGPNKLECNIVLELIDLSVANTLAYSYNKMCCEYLDRLYNCKELYKKGKN